MSSTEGGTDRKVASGPQMHTLYSVPDFSAPSPECVNKKSNAENVIFNWGGVKILKVSPGVVVKFGSHVTVNEARNMIFVEQNTENVPVPKVFACYTHGPICRDVDDFGSLYDTYIFMSFVEGESLDKVWELCDETAKSRITSQLKGYFYELRCIDNGNYIGSADLGPVTDPILETHHTKGPFPSEEDFNNAIIDAYISKAPKRQIKDFLAGMLSHNKHQIVFTHGDLRLQNIMIKDGNISGILDWEFSGWYPEYWEFSKALYVWRWQNDWSTYLAQVLRPYYSEYAIHSFLTETLW